MQGVDRKVEWEEFRDIVLEIREGEGLGDFGEFGEGIENEEDEVRIDVMQRRSPNRSANPPLAAGVEGGRRFYDGFDSSEADA